MEHVASERISWKAALDKERPLLLPVAHDALAAKILEQAGFTALQVARVAEDDRLIRVIDGLDPARLDQPLDYLSTTGERFRTPLRIVLGHLFNHQTHHRGQAHGLISQTLVPPPELDLIYFVREA